MRAVHYLSILAIAGVFACCSKGNTGATGPAGPTGATGAQGAKGDTGAKGNANVVAAQFSVTAWTYTNPNWYAVLSVPALNSTILNSGAVEVFLSPNAGTNWYALPYTQYGAIANYIAGYITGLNSVEVTWIYNSAGSGSDPNTYYSTSACLINVVCIAPAVVKKHSKVNWKNPAEVNQLPEVKVVLDNMNIQ